jgi:CheY-like chemotaxis protein
MPVISLFSASHCHGDEVCRRVAERLGLHVLSNEELFAGASERYKVSPEKLNRTMHGPRSFFHRWNREKERCVAYLRASLAELLSGDDMLYHGYAGHLIPKSQTHVLRVCLVAASEYREAQGVEEAGLSPKEASKPVRKEDQASQEWVGYLHGVGPWTPSLYDILLPMDSTPVEEAVEVICENAGKEMFRASADTRREVTDFQLASRVGVTLAEHGHNVEVAALSGAVTVTIDHYVMRLQHLEDELKKLAGAVPGVKSVATRLGPNFQQPEIYAKLDLPRKILLVDDEKDFVRVLSERLETRDLGASLAFDGEQALAMIETDAPDVMVLDLRMPGIDGLEVLRKVKREHPETEVIILTGHGSEKDRELALGLGAFAYLQKPADIDILADTMKRAYEKAWERNQARGEGTTPDDSD